MPVPIAKQLKAASWIDKNVKPLIASLASGGNMDGVEAMEILDGIEGILATIKFVEQHGDAIRRGALQG